MTFRTATALTALVAVLVLTACSTPKPEQTASSSTDRLIKAYLFDAPVRVGDYDKGMGPEAFRNDTGPNEDARVIAAQRVVNDFRAYALPRLAAKLIPDCQTEPTDEDMRAFYPYWRRTLQADIARMPELADRAAIAKREAQNAQMAQVGLRILPQTPVPDMLKVSAAAPGADPIARRLIRQWRLYHCVQAHYGGDKFFSLWTDPDGAGWHPDRLAYCLEAVEDGSHGLPAPCMQPAEPISAIGALFHEAKDKGLMRLSSPGADKYFFDRYDGEEFARVKEPEKVKPWFSSPPWLAME
jgi:hypothetical protein